MRGDHAWGAVFFFFFSSRRRHTRLVGDWSSDVCSSDLSDSTGGGGGSPCSGQGADVTVSAGGNLRFSPDSILISVGQKVCWQNTSSLNHTVTSDTGTILSGTLNGAGTFTVKTCSAAGIVTYHCV